MTQQKSALIIGATGLVGNALLGQLLDDPDYDQVTVFVRRSTGRQHTKLMEHVIDFGQPATWQSLVRGDVLFSALGTTRAQAGGTAAQRIVDYDYQYAFAQAAAANGVGTYVLVSSVGANASSTTFYMKMKGELDQAVMQLPFAHVHILRPGPLTGPRAQPRSGEAMAVAVMRVVNALGLFQQYKPIKGEEVAQVMRKVVSQSGRPAKIHEPKELFAQLCG